MAKLLYSSVAFIALTAGSASALSVTTESDGSTLADTLFLNVPGLSVTSAIFSGFEGQGGVYNNTSGTYGLPLDGIILSTGNVADYESGPNEASGTTTSYDDFGGEFEGEFLAEVDFEEGDDFPFFEGSSIATDNQQDLLFPITGQGTHFDVAQLTITFDAADDVEGVTFFGTFGSEEFPEFVGSSFIDGFGLYVNDVNVAGVLETGGVPGDDLLAVNIDHPDMTAIAGTELDGVLAPNGSPVLRFDVPVEAGTTNTFDIILADASDSALDTTVYLSSFIAAQDPIDPIDPIDPVDGAGENEFNPLLPANPADPETGEFIIEMPDVDAGQIIWIDPPVTVGYTYSTDLGLFDTVTAPSLATVPDLDGYLLTVGAQTEVLAAGATIDFFGLFGVNPTEFTITGIDESLMLDPLNPLAFPIGVAYLNDASGASITITPISVDGMAAVPLPASSLLLGAGLAGLFGLRRRSNKLA